MKPSTYISGQLLDQGVPNPPFPFCERMDTQHDAILPTRTFTIFYRREYRSDPNLFPQAHNTPSPVGIPCPLLHDPLNSFVIARTTP